MKPVFIIAGLTLCVLIQATNSFATKLSLYAEPTTQGKPIHTLETNNGMVTIFTAKDGQWIKVGDPNNGNVGWIKKSELSASNPLNISQNVFYSSSSKMVNGMNPSSSINTDHASPNESALMKRLYEKQKTLQKAAESMFQEMFHGINQSFPMMLPIIIFPEQSQHATHHHPHHHAMSETLSSK